MPICEVYGRYEHPGLRVEQARTRQARHRRSRSEAGSSARHDPPGADARRVLERDPTQISDRARTRLELVELWPSLHPVVPTRADHIVAGGHLAIRHRLQFWDSVILAIARSESVGVLLTEDMQDGATIDGVTILNPFNPANRPALDSLLAG